MTDQTPLSVINTALNIAPSGDGGPFDLQTFYEIYPHFEQLVNPAISSMFLAMVKDMVNPDRFNRAYNLACAALLGHFITLWLETNTGTNPSAKEVIGQAMAKGLITSSSAGDVSYSADYSQISKDFSGWGQLALTTYGQTYIQLVKPLGKTMYVW